MRCSIQGERVPWKKALNDDAGKEKALRDFYEIWKARPIEDNAGGGGFFHYFALYNVLKNLRITTVVESGAFKGVGTWFIRQIVGPKVQIVVLTPQMPQIYRDKINSAYLTDGNFQDFNKVDWARPVGTEQLVVDPSSTLIFFDDHQAAIRRINEAHARGFRYLVFDDGYPPGTGDNLSCKKLCSPKLWAFLGVKQYTFQDNFGKTNNPLSESEFMTHVNQFRSKVKIYADFPPAWEGPTRFGMTEEKYGAITEKPLFRSDELGKRYGIEETTMQKGSFAEESKRYTFIGYLELMPLKTK